MPARRFVILTHDHPFLHWDLMLDFGEALRTWRLLAEPAPGADVPAEALPDHRRAYLDYEGPVSEGRGTVVRWDAGEFEVVPNGGDEQLRLHLTCGRLSGVASLHTGPVGTFWRFEPLEK
jgi:hypothetical protein